jgi:hypothetical protein
MIEDYDVRVQMSVRMLSTNASKQFFNVKLDAARD